VTSGRPGGLLARIFPSLEHRDFRLLWLAQTSQASAMWMELITRNWLTLEMTGSALQLGAVNFVRAIPAIIVGMWGGVLADRFPKKQVLLLGQTWSLTVYAIMTWVVFSGELQLWHLYASSVGLSLGMSITQPVRAAYVPAVVPEHHVIGALSLNAVAMNGTRFVWPALAGLLIATADAGWAYLIATGFYVVLQGVTLLLRNSGAPSVGSIRSSMADDFMEGLRFVLGNRIVLGLIASRFGPITVGSAFQVLVPVFAVQVLGMGAGAYGALLSADGLGAIIGGTLIASRRHVLHQGLLAVSAGTAVSLLLILASFVELLPLAALVFLMVGLSQVTFQATNNGSLFSETPPHIRGRVIGLRNQTRSLVPVSQLGAAALADAASVSWAIGAVGGVSLAVLWGVQAWRPELRKL
jgi:MFS family permease